MTGLDRIAMHASRLKWSAAVQLGSATHPKRVDYCGLTGHEVRVWYRDNGAVTNAQWINPDGTNGGFAARGAGRADRIIDHMAEVSG